MISSTQFDTKQKSGMGKELVPQTPEQSLFFVSNLSDDHFLLKML